MPKIISFDPAIKNLGYVKLNYSKGDEQPNINEFDLIDLSLGKKTKPTIDQISTRLKLRLDDIDLDDVDMCLIENIPSIKNPTVKTISIMLYMYFKTKGLTVFLVSPSRKLSKEQNQKLNYNQRKKASVEKCFNVISKQDKDKIIEFVNKNKCQTADIADCINQSMAFVERERSSPGSRTLFTSHF